ncbi:hypothetical protein GY45DRAFT_1221604, partial [Cubamyces sp. BRFM 1775]
VSCLLFNIAIEPLAAALRKSALRGISLPGAPERLVAKLFADDTTAFLGPGDDYTEIVRVTDTWCRGSGAKFNLGKTEFIPIGTKEFRDRVIATRALGPGTAPFPHGTKVAKDGEAIRILGAWLGNKVNSEVSWHPLLALMRKNLARWARSNPTLRGKKLIVGMEIGGRTQFRAKAQGMPPAVETCIKNMIRHFIWGEAKRPAVAYDILLASEETGGLALLDIAARNDAIDLMWLKSYLDFSVTRP